MHGAAAQTLEMKRQQPEKDVAIPARVTIKRVSQRFNIAPL